MGTLVPGIPGGLLLFAVSVAKHVLMFRPSGAITGRQNASAVAIRVVNKCAGSLCMVRCGSGLPRPAPPGRWMEQIVGPPGFEPGTNGL